MPNLDRWIIRVTKDSARNLLLIGKRWKHTHPEAFTFAKRLLNQLPWLEARIRILMARQAGLTAQVSKRHHRRGSKVDLQDFPASVRKVYLDLKQAIEDQGS
jgi:hypothetical protein